MKRTWLLLLLLVAAPAGADCLQLALGQNWTFYLQANRFSSGAAYDATGSPVYRLYEEETATPILTGSLALLDDANTVGLYSEQVAANAANGFEIGKCYAVYMTATVDSVAAAKTDCACISFRTDTSGYVAAAGGAAIDDNPWDAGARTLTAIDEDSTTLDLNATTIGTVSSVTDLADNAIDAAAIAPDSIGSSEIAASAIGSSEAPNLDAAISTRSSHSAADVWAVGSRTVTAATNITSTGGTTVPQTGDSYARLGAPAGASVSADVAAVKTETASILTDTNLYDTDAEYATAIWNAATATYGSAGSYGLAVETLSTTDILGNACATYGTEGTVGETICDITGATISVAAPAIISGTAITITKGDSYVVGGAGVISFTDLSGLGATDTLAVKLERGGATVATYAATYVSASACTLSLSAAQTGALTASTYKYRLVRTTTGSLVQTLLRDGSFTVLPSP